MTRTQIAAASIVALFGITIAGAQTSAPAGAGGSASIAGIVVHDQTTEAVERAQVTLIDSLGAGPNRTMNASEAGVFKFSGLPAGRYELRALKPPFLDGSYGADTPERLGRPIVIAANAQIDNVRLSVFTGAVVAGTVWSPDNQPMRASVVVIRTTYLPGGRRLEATSNRVTTDERGRFRIFGLPPDDYAIAAIPSAGNAAGPVVVPIYFPGTERYEAASRLTLAAGDQRLDADIHVPTLPARSIHVQVRTEDGSNLAGPEVRFAVSPQANSPGFGEFASRAGTDGVVANLVPGPYRVSATATVMLTPPAGGSASMYGEALVDVAAAGPVQDVTVLLRRRSVLSGGVTARSLAPSPRDNFGTARMWLTEIGGNVVGPKRYEATAASTARFLIQGVPPGRYQIDARGVVAGGGLPLWTLRSVSRDGQPIDRIIDVGGNITDSDISGLELTLVDDLATLSGSILGGDGRPAPPYFIVLIATTPDASGTPQAYYARPAADGSYRLAGILEGEYALAVIQDVRPSDLNNPGMLAQFKAAATMTLTFAPNENKRQDLRVGYPFPLPLTFDLSPLTFPMRPPW